MLALFSILIAFFAEPAQSELHPPCGGPDHACEIAGGAGGRYYVARPPDWDGKRPLGALLFFHGYRSSGAEFIKNASVLEAARRGGYLLVAADGIRGTWSHTGSPSHNRNEVAYVEGLLADLAHRFPIDQKNLWVAGFSQGGSMVWEVACYLGPRFKAFVAIAGAFWNPLPETCPSGPVNMLHIHGTTDRTVPMLGRPIGPFRQGEVMKAVAVIKTVDRCEALPQSKATTGPFVCETWSTCESGSLVRLCLHGRGHEIPRAWADLAYQFMREAGRTKSSN